MGVGRVSGVASAGVAASRSQDLPPQPLLVLPCCSQVIGEVLLSNKPVHVVASASRGQPVAVAGAGGNLYLAELH